MSNRSPFYHPAVKWLGLLLIVWGIFSFFIKHHRQDLWDYNVLAGLTSWGLFFVLFAREKIDDERVRYLKFRSLGFGVFAGLLATHLINYFMLNPEEPGSNTLSVSISGYASIGIVLLTSLLHYYILKGIHKAP